MTALKTTLCFDCSTIQASISLFVGDVLVDELVSTTQRSHSEFITAALEKLLKKANRTPGQTDQILLTNGPGSFTGIRVSVGLAKALSYANGTPLWVVDSLSLLRSQADRRQACFASLNAYKNLIFGSFFEENSVSSTPSVYTFSEARLLLEEQTRTKNVSLVGDGFELYKELLSSDVLLKLKTKPHWEVHPKSSWMFALHQSSPEIGKTLDWNYVNPLYIRGSEAEENLRK